MGLVQISAAGRRDEVVVAVGGDAVGAMLLLICLDQGEASYGKSVGRHSKHRSRRFRSSRKKFSHRRRKSKHRKRSKRSHGSSTSTHQIESKIERLESRMDRMSKRDCSNGHDGDEGHCTLCRQTDEDRQLSFQFPDDDDRGSGRLACCLADETVDGIGRCVGNNFCDQFSSVTFSGDDNLLYLRNIRYDLGEETFQLSCNDDGCCTVMEGEMELEDYVDMVIGDCRLYLEQVDGDSDSCDEEDAVLLRVVAGVEADGGSSSGLDFDLYNSVIHQDQD